MIILIKCVVIRSNYIIANPSFKAYGDRAFYNDVVRAMKIHAAQSQEKVYCYKFSYRGKYGVGNLIKDYKFNDDYGKYYVSTQNQKYILMKRKM